MLLVMYFWIRILHGHLRIPFFRSCCELDLTIKPLHDFSMPVISICYCIVVISTVPLPEFYIQLQYRTLL